MYKRQVNYYTLQAPQTESRAPATNAANEFIEVMPITMSASADYSHLMVRVQNTAVSPLYSQRWTASLADEFRATLSADQMHNAGLQRRGREHGRQRFRLALQASWRPCCYAGWSRR